MGIRRISMSINLGVRQQFWEFRMPGLPLNLYTDLKAGGSTPYFSASHSHKHAEEIIFNYIELNML